MDNNKQAEMFDRLADDFIRLGNQNAKPENIYVTNLRRTVAQAVIALLKYVGDNADMPRGFDTLKTWSFLSKYALISNLQQAWNVWTLSVIPLLQSDYLLHITPDSHDEVDHAAHLKIQATNYSDACRSLAMIIRDHDTATVSQYANDDDFWKDCPNLTKAANDVAINKGKLSKWCNSGKIRHKKVGKETKIDINSLQKYLEPKDTADESKQLSKMSGSHR